MAASIWGAEPIIQWITTSPVFDNRWLGDLAKLRASAEQATTLPARNPSVQSTDRYSSQNSETSTAPLYNHLGQSAPQAKATSTDEAAPSTYQDAEPSRQDQAQSSPATDAADSQAASLSESELALVRELAQIDRNTRAHEAAHLSAAAGLAVSGMNFGYTRGPDGIHYATSGEVSIDTSKVANDPEATYRKALQIQTAALAPRDPSPQDHAVAAMARQMANEALMDIARQRNQPAASDAIQRYLTTLTPPTSTGTNLFA